MKLGVKKKQKISDIIATKTGKYFLAIQKGSNKVEAQKQAGFAMANKSHDIEKSDSYQALQEHFGVNLQKHITVNEINSYLADNIRQNDPKTGVPGRIDRNARNKAIEIAKEMIAPANAVISDGADKVLIVLSK